jgi:glucose-6-phosphate isomerase
MRMRSRVDGLLRFVEEVAAPGLIDTFVLLGMGGSSLAPEVLGRTFDAEAFHVLDTTHPAAIRRLTDSLDFDATLFLVASKSGTTLETRCHLDWFWERSGKRGEYFVAITDPGSELEQVARERSFLASFEGEPTIGGRYSALSVFGVVPAALMGVDLERFLDRVDEIVEACHGEDGNPGLDLGLELGHGWAEGRDKITINPNTGGFGLWAEQLLAESTGKGGKGLIPAPDEAPDGPDRQASEVRLPGPYELGQEFYRWEFATAVAGSILRINPFDQPNVQAAKDKTNEVLAAGGDPNVEPRGSLEELFARAEPGDYVAIQAFVDPAREAELRPLVERARAETGCVVTRGLGPRYLHSTGQLHKGGPNTGLFVQVVDDAGDELRIPGRDSGFRRLIHAQAAGDLASLEERGRRIVRVRLEEL